MRLFHIDRKHLTYLGLLVLGISIGIALAYSIAREIQLGEGRSGLRDYAERLVGIGDQILGEASQAITSVTEDNLPFCSDRELAFMRDYVFRSAYIRDIGRTQNEMLYCTSGGGVLKPPPHMMIPDISSGGWNVAVRTPVKISVRTQGFVMEKDSVSLVLNPDAIAGFNEPPKFFSALLIDRPNHRMIRSFGPATPLTLDEVLAGKLIERDGVFYQPLCSKTSIVCEVAIESRASLLAGRGPYFVDFLVGGALLGFAVTALLIVLYNARVSLLWQLRSAIRKNKLTLVYQPVVDLDTHAIVGAEALVRWVNKLGESVPPDVFVPIAERRGFICEITRLVVRKALTEMRGLLVDGNFRLTINITADDLRDRGFSAHLEQSMRTSGANPRAVGFELTERSTADHEVAIRAIRDLRQAGHLVYIDDFGTGYSSLSYLHRLSADAIKIDRVFTQTVDTYSVMSSVVPKVLEIAAELNLMVVAEGIETSEQAEYFRKASTGILGQGWFFGRPVPAAQFMQLLQENTKSIRQLV